MRRFHKVKTGRNRNTIIGMNAKSNDGHEMTIVAARVMSDLDVRFEDGTIVQHKSFEAFSRGKIRYPVVNNRLGEERTLEGGKGKIVAYRSASDIDVLFENGKMATHCDYEHFKKGKILPDEMDHKRHRQSKFEGLTLKMNCGMTATIIWYRKATDIDVEFQDGYIARHRTLRNFQYGLVSNPNILNESMSVKKQRLPVLHVGDSKKMNNGMIATIKEYRSSASLDVQFEDGTVVKNRTANAFRSGQIRNPNLKPQNSHLNYSALKEKRLGEEKMMRCGMRAKITRYENSEDVDFIFEDGSTATGRPYGRFTAGTLIPDCCVKTVRKDRIGETMLNNQNLEMTIIAYRSSADLDVQFEDGTVVKNRTYQTFQNGSIKDPNMNVYASRLHEKRIMNNGMVAEIIRYASSHDIDVKFDDGVVIEGTTYGQFCDGSLRNKFTGNVPKETRIGLTRTMNCGLTATIIDYRGCHDLDIEFSDGIIARHKSYQAFKDGHIAHQSS